MHTPLILKNRIGRVYYKHLKLWSHHLLGCLPRGTSAHILLSLWLIMYVPVFSNVDPPKPLWGSPPFYPCSRIEQDPASYSGVQSTGRRSQQAQAGLKGAHLSCKSPSWGRGLTCSLGTEASSAQVTAANPPHQGTDTWLHPPPPPPTLTCFGT